MFDIGFAELLLLAIVALVVIGPERLPEAARTAGLWMGRLRRIFSSAKMELEKELHVDDVRRQLHNEQIMSELKSLEKSVKDGIPGNSDKATTKNPEEISDTSNSDKA